MSFGQTIPTPQTATLMFPVDGACHRVGPQETAYAYRDATLAVALGASWPDPADDDANIAWSRQNHDRLAEVKRGYDLDNRFRLNQNILPARSRG